MKNKKASDKIISVYWFAILIIVSGAIIYMTAIFYGAPYDIREVEANVFASKIANCLSDKGKIRGDVISDGKFVLTEDNFLEICRLRFNTEETWKDVQYFSDIEFYSVNNLNQPIYSLSAGNKNFASACNIDEEGKKKLVQCVEKRMYSVGENIQDQYLIKITSAIRKTEKNAQ